MNDDPNGTNSNLHRLWAALAGQGYALTSEDEVGFPDGFRDYFLKTYFTDAHIRHDPGDWPQDRKRARDVIRYLWQGESLRLEEHDTIALTDRAGIPGKREHSRVRLLDDARAEGFIGATLNLVPPDRRKITGTFGVNLFRTFTDVVTKPHHDSEEFVILYVLGRKGEGAETYLCGLPSEGESVGVPILRKQLNPGDIIIFDDARFLHGATPLEPLPDGTAMRDVLVCTVDSPDTYLSELGSWQAAAAPVGSRS
jgi:2OG-Fe dioxygenase